MINAVTGVCDGFSGGRGGAPDSGLRVKGERVVEERGSNQGSPPREGIAGEQRPIGQWHLDQFGTQRSPQRGARLVQGMLIESRSMSGKYSMKKKICKGTKARQSMEGLSPQATVLRN